MLALKKNETHAANSEYEWVTFLGFLRQENSTALHPQHMSKIRVLLKMFQGKFTFLEIRDLVVKALWIMLRAYTYVLGMCRRIH
jgi:hypothetical protein